MVVFMRRRQLAMAAAGVLAALALLSLWLNGKNRKQ